MEIKSANILDIISVAEKVLLLHQYGKDMYMFISR
jgi:hypothetical protein